MTRITKDFMSHATLYWSTVVLIGFLCIGYYWYTRHVNGQHTLDGKLGLESADIYALEKLLEAASVSPGNVRVVEVALDEPCWYADWSSVDRLLGVYKRFGAFGENCIGVTDKKIVSISLVHHELESTALLEGMQSLQTIQLREGRIQHFAEISSMPAWKHLNLQSNALRDVSALKKCRALEMLDLSFNEIQALEGLAMLQQLTRFHADNNDIERIEGLENHSALKRLVLTNNNLSSLAALTGMTQLEELHVSGNQISTLQELDSFPALRSIRAGSNPISSLDRGLLDEFPRLRHVALYQTDIASVPAGFVSGAKNSGLAEIVTEEMHTDNFPRMRVDISGTPLAEQLASTQLAWEEEQLAKGGVVTVDALPQGRGRAQGTKQSGSAGGFLSQSVNAQGTMMWLEGTHSVGFDALNQSVGVTVKASVEKGRLRVYLKNSEGGFYYALAGPQYPLEISGYLLTGSSKYFIYFESVNGRAEGISWSVQ